MARLNKGSKKVARQVDPFFIFMSKVSNFFKAKWKAILSAVIVVILITGVAFFVDYLKAKKEENGWISYLDINLKAMEQNKEPDSLQEIIISYPGTLAAKLSSIQTASSLYREGRYDTALQYLEDIGGEENPFIKTNVMLLRAKILEKLGKLNEAISIYEDLMLDEDAVFLGPEAFIQDSILYFKTGNIQAAMRTLTQGAFRFQRGFESLALLLQGFARLMALNLVNPSELP